MIQNDISTPALYGIHLEEPNHKEGRLKRFFGWLFVRYEWEHSPADCLNDPKCFSWS
jgi:hypothetical protein